MADLQELVNSGALIGIENKFGETPLDKSQTNLAKVLHGLFIVEFNIKLRWQLNTVIECYCLALQWFYVLTLIFN